MRTGGIVVFCILLTLVGRPSEGAEGMGLGVIVGEPTGLTVKTWLAPSTAFNLAVAWSFESEDALHLHGDYLIHNYNTFPVSKGALPFYYGLGARLKLEDHDSAVGLRVPVGVEYLFRNDPIDLFFEVVPILDVTPATELGLNVAVGARYFLR